VFSLTPPPPGKHAWKFQVIYAFKGGFDGSRPATGLARTKASGVLFGTTLWGSSLCDCGTIFRLIPPAAGGEWRKDTFHEFSGDSFDGSVPNSTPFYDSSTLQLYGTTGSIGGSGGTIYRITLPGDHLTVIYNPAQKIGDFVGYHPQGVVVDADSIYGTAFDGAYSGTLFRIAANGTGKVLHGFSGPDGAGPQAPPILAPDGTLYGTASEGGNPNDCPNSPGCGTLWEKPPSSREKTLHSFRFFVRNRDGMDPISPLVLDEQTGTLYGTTYYGGDGTVCGGDGGSCGTVFKVDAQGDYQVVWQFPNGGPANPQGQLVFFDGALYGTSYDGGKACSDQHYIGCGTVWKLTP
jgi:uncharacterized repeat protein (TIGR03803 family)